MSKYLKKYTVILLLLALVAFFSLTAKGFATAGNMISLLRQVAILGIVSVGMTMIIITGNIDLSVGSQVSLICCLVATMIVKSGMPPLISCIVGILAAMVLTTLNGAIILSTSMPAMLCTLATMQIYQGITYMFTGAIPIYGLPESMRFLGQGYIWFIPVPVVIMLAIFVLGGFLLSKTYLGRYFYAVGSNAEAARLSGISVKSTKLLAFTICGFFVGLASVVLMSRMFSGHPTAGSGLEMEVVTAVVVGGVAFSGGSGKIAGVMQGVLLMGVLSNGLGIMGVGTNVQLVFKGTIPLLVVGLDCYQQQRQRMARMALPTASLPGTDANAVPGRK